MLKVYVGCGIYNAPDDFVQNVEALKQQLKRKYHVLDFLFSSSQDADPFDVVKFDLQNVKEANFFLAIADYPSLGLGIEIGKANELKKPTLIVANTENVSKMVRGNKQENPNSEFKVYSDFNHLLDIVDEFVSKYFSL